MAEQMQRCGPGGCTGDCDQGRHCADSWNATRRAIGVRAIRFCNGGETVTNGTADSACDYCTNGVCRELQACESTST